MLEWWNDVRMLVARYLVASDQMERSGPVAAAVRQAGYVSEDEDVSEQEDGSSLDDHERHGHIGQDFGAQYDIHHDKGNMEGQTPVPTYSSHPGKDSGVHLDEHGYTVHEKDDAGPDSGRDDYAEHSGVIRQYEKAPEGRGLHSLPGDYDA